MALVNDSYDAGYGAGYDHANYAVAYGERIDNPDVRVPAQYDPSDYLTGYMEGAEDYQTTHSDSFEMDCV